MRVVENEQGSRSTPSVVAFGDDGAVLVGPPAKNLLFSTRAKAVVGHQLLHGVTHGSPAFDELVAAGALPFETAAEAESGAALVQVSTASATHPNADPAPTPTLPLALTLTLTVTLSR